MSAARRLKSIHPLVNVYNLAGKPIGYGPKPILDFLLIILIILTMSIIYSHQNEAIWEG